MTRRRDCSKFIWSIAILGSSPLAMPQDFPRRLEYCDFKGIEGRISALGLARLDGPFKQITLQGGKELISVPMRPLPGQGFPNGDDLNVLIPINAVAPIGDAFDDLGPDKIPGDPPVVYFLGGWTSRNLHLDLPTDIGNRVFKAFDVSSRSVYAPVCLPTRAAKLLAGSDGLGRLYRNLAAAIHGSSGFATRWITNAIADRWETEDNRFCASMGRLGANPGPWDYTSIEGTLTATWITNNLSPLFNQVLHDNLLTEFRIGALLAAFDRPHRSIPFLKGANDLFHRIPKEPLPRMWLGPQHNSAYDDATFPVRLHLYRQVDKRELMKFGLATNDRTILVGEGSVDLWADKDLQTKYYKWLNNQSDRETRGAAYCNLFVWQGGTATDFYPVWASGHGEPQIRAQIEKYLGVPSTGPP